MRLRTRTILWLLPVTLPLLFYSLLQYHAQSRALETSIRHAATLATTGAADEINGLLWAALSAFSTLSGEQDACEPGAPSGGQLPARLDADLRANPYFGLLALVDADGVVTAARPAPIDSNRHILPHNVVGERLLAIETLRPLAREFADWQGGLARSRDRLADDRRELEALARVGEFNSARYRLLQQQVAQSAMVIEHGPRDVVFGGGDLAARAGLPFRADTFLFAAVRHPCCAAPCGYVVAMLDWTQVEDILFKYAGRLRTGDLEAAEVLLVDRVTMAPLSAVNDIAPGTLRAAAVTAGGSGQTAAELGSRTADGGLLASARVVDDHVLSALEHSLKSGEPVTHGRYRALVDAGSSFSVVSHVPAAALDPATVDWLPRLALSGLANLLLLLGLIWLLAKHTVAPITGLARTMQRAAAGDLEVRAETTRRDEIGDLGRVFNGMIAALASRRAELETNLSLLGATLESTGDGIMVVDRDRRVTLSNARLAELWRLPPDLVHSGDDARVVAYAMEQLEDPQTFLETVEAAYGDPEAVSEDVLTFRDGRVFERFSMPQRVNGRVVGRVWSFGDITRRKQAEDRLRLAAAVFTHAGEGIMISDADGTILDVNASFLRLTGYERDAIVGRRPSVLSSGRHGKAFYESLWRGLRERGLWSGEVWNRRRDGAILPLRLTISAVPDADGRPRHYVALYTDISEQLRHREELEHVAHHDPLTELPNRLLLGRRLQHAMARADAQRSWIAIAYLDLDGFKAVNDAHGHAAGDRLLVLVARRIRSFLRDGDTVARIGGDELAMVLVDLKEPGDALPLLERLLAGLAEPMQIGEHSVRVTASVGVTLYPQDQEVDGDLLLRQADQAMYQAKESGKNRYRVFGQ